MKRSQAWLSEDFALPRRPDTLLEEKGYARGLKRVAGLDEVGRGPWAGPVVAAAVIFPRGVIHPDIRDSKLLTAKKRQELARWIKQEAVAWALGIVGPEEIDRINILRASLLAMSVAVARLRPMPELLLIDGRDKIPLEFFKAEGERREAEGNGEQDRDDFVLPLASRLMPLAFPRQKAVVKGDLVCHSIAAASIVAKVARDQIMAELDDLYPEYGFRQHKGYGSQAHAEAIKRLGPCPIHRRSFSPVWKAFERAGQLLSGALFAER
ncbi:MAG TPA: ribonuclease HII [Candidatus Binatia bacterium]|jgi:ribonuclease HII